MGDLIADAQFAYGRELDPETDLVLMNLGGVRAGLTYAAKGSEGDLVGTDDLSALAQYLTANSSATAPLAPPATNRVTIVQ